MMATAAVTACTANYRPDPFDLLNANIEALAQDESLDPGEGGGMANACCPIWNVSYTTSWLDVTITCSTGGNYKCKDCTCPN